MTLDIALTLLIVLVAAVLLFSEWLRSDLVALMVLGSLALLGLVTPGEALSGYSNPAVITVWAVFILSGGLARTGVAGEVGKLILRVAGQREVGLLIVIMTSAGLLSAFMNNVGVAALLLPVVMDIARRTDQPPSRLLMPLAYGCLLGGLTTLIGTPPNILASDALVEFGLEPFSLFDFAPVGSLVMVGGIAFMILIGRRLLPDRNIRQELVGQQAASLRDAFELEERLSTIEVTPASGMGGKTLAESRIGLAAGLNVIGIVRERSTQLAPAPDHRLKVGDRLLVAGRLDRLYILKKQQLPIMINERLTLSDLVSREVQIVQLSIGAGSSFLGQTLDESGLRRGYGVNVLAVLRGDTLLQHNLAELTLQLNDQLLVQIPNRQVPVLEQMGGLTLEREINPSFANLHENLFAVRLPPDSALDKQRLGDSSLSEVYGLNVAGILRTDHTILAPGPDTLLHAGDTLLVEGRPEDLDLLRSLQRLRVDLEAPHDLSELESPQVGLAEVVLAPRTSLVGSTLRSINFRDKFGLNVLAIYRQGRAYRSSLSTMALRFGDALLVHGRRSQIQVLSQEPDFIVLEAGEGEPPRRTRALPAILIMAGVVLSVLLGWLPIAIAAVVGGTLMVLTGCLTMEEAYRSIEWRAVFLIAGMLPLGIALEKTGAAGLIASGVVASVGGYGPVILLSALFILTALASQLMPNPVVTVLMAPIAINTAQSLGFSPQSLMMIIAISASASFLSPVGHPANLLVMGPGGYRFSDFLRVGLPLTLIVLVIAVLAVPVFWPL